MLHRVVLHIVVLHIVVLHIILVLHKVVLHVVVLHCHKIVWGHSGDIIGHATLAVYLFGDLLLFCYSVFSGDILYPYIYIFFFFKCLDYII